MSDVSAFMAELASQQNAQLAEAKTMRTNLLPQLKAAGIATVFATYSGYGDSGDIEALSCDGGSLDHETEKAVSDLLWTYLWSKHRGFEINEGGQGQITWEIATDRITIDHEDNIVDIERSRDEF